MPLRYVSKNIPRAKELRNQMTPEERHLWYDFLSSYPVRFLRQKTIDHFIADFFCYQAKLVIEVDGSQHYTAQGQKYDNFRTEILEGYDLKVIRFTNEQIRHNFRGVCEYIDRNVKSSMQSE